MRIHLTKSNDRHHKVEILRLDGSRDRIELVTREALYHDFLHYAVESSLPTQGGFWGALARGKTFADLNDRTGQSTQKLAATLYAVEGAVGMMHGVLDASPDQAFAKMQWLYQSQGNNPPDWCKENFVAAVCERMRQLQGQWKATPYGETMEIEWLEHTSENPRFVSGVVRG